jgi:maltooligosyltrehalose trehalohydrolase
MLFQGEEWAASSPFPYFCDTDEAELAAAITEGRRQEFADFGWDPAAVADPVDPATMATAVLRWDERHDGDHGRVLAWYRRLLRLRRQRTDLTDDRRYRTKVVVDERARRLVVDRGATTLEADLATPRAVIADASGAILADSALR